MRKESLSFFNLKNQLLQQSSNNFGLRMDMAQDYLRKTTRDLYPNGAEMEQFAHKLEGDGRNISNLYSPDPSINGKKRDHKGIRKTSTFTDAGAPTPNFSIKPMFNQANWGNPQYLQQPFLGVSNQSNLDLQRS
jgi:hypothetical protein